MRFASLSISNFRAIRRFSIGNLTDFILIAGPNGCGKSCVLDAIRLLKSAYGGYNANEVMQWFGEFQINLSDRASLRQVFRDPASEVVIEAKVQLSESEIHFVAANAASLAEPIIWRGILGSQYDELRYQQYAFATMYREHGDKVAAAVQQYSATLRAEVAQADHTLRLTIAPDGQISLALSPSRQFFRRTNETNSASLTTIAPPGPMLVKELPPA